MSTFPFSLLFPLGLLALAALPIILWLHLRRRRLRRVVVPSLLLWKHLNLPHSMQQRRWLPLTLLLILHLLIAGVIGLVLANPHGLVGIATTTRYTALIVDTSTSMGASDMPAGTRLDEAHARARSLINTMSGDDRLWVIAAGRAPALLTSGTMGTRAEMLPGLDELALSGEGTALAEALTMARLALELDQPTMPGIERRVVVYSDLEPPTDMLPLDEHITWERIGSNPVNRAVVALAARPSGDPTSAGHFLYARFANYGSSAITTRFELYGDDRVIDTHLVKLNPDSEVEWSWDLQPGFRVVRVELDGQDVLPRDDTAALSLNQSRTIETLLVSNSPGPLAQALDAVPGVQVEPVAPATYRSAPLAARADLTVFESTLADATAWPTGGVLVVNPPTDSPLLTVHTATAELSETAELHRFDEGTALLDGLSLGSVDFGPLVEVDVGEPSPWAVPFLSLRNNTSSVPLILRGSSGQSEVAVWTFDLAQSNLPTKLAFPLLVARTVRDLLPSPLPETLAAGDPLVVSPGPRTDTVVVRFPDGTTRELAPPEEGGAVQIESLVEPGTYTIEEKQGETLLHTSYVAVNAGSPLESNLLARPAPALAYTPPLPPGTSPPSAEASNEDEYRSLRTILILAALVLLMIEWVYLNVKRQDESVA